MTGHPVLHIRYLRERVGRTVPEWRAACSCGWTGPARLHPLEARDDWAAHRDDELTALEADIGHDRDWDLQREVEL